MNVILQQDVHNLGKTGEVVRVRPGFARNFLLPNGMAASATTNNVNRLAHEKRQAEAKNAKAKAAATELAAKIAANPISLARKVGEENKLFGAVTTKEIEAALAEKGVEVDRRKIALAEPIKTTGTFELPVKLGYDVTATIKVEVTAKK
ncbi:MAG: 50S ribosomal protein L9 [Polyangiales bacterium]